MRRPDLVLQLLVGVALAIAVLAVVVGVARRQRAEPARCPPPLQLAEARCCAPGQRESAGRCTGAASSCPEHLDLIDGACVAPAKRVALGPGRVRLGPSDWEAQGRVRPRLIEVEAFELDATEVDHRRWSACVVSGPCSALRGGEPGQPVTGLTPEQAAGFCQFAGGRLPTGDEWIFASAGSAGRRFPWGQTGLVCRRASFGLMAGPCAVGGVVPEITGARPAGRSPDGIHDLAGNVAEWTLEPDGSHLARGGSFGSRMAADLKSWSAEAIRGASAQVGFRCAYPSRR